MNETTDKFRPQYGNPMDSIEKWAARLIKSEIDCAYYKWSEQRGDKVNWNLMPLENENMVMCFMMLEIISIINSRWRSPFTPGGGGGERQRNISPYSH